MAAKLQLINLWKQIYPHEDIKPLDDFLEEIDPFKKDGGENSDWYKDAVIYSLYVDLFNTDFQGLENKLDYLQDLGVNCLWLLPILDSPMKDAGFDIKDYRHIRPDLLGLTHAVSDSRQEEIFGGFLQSAHSKGIRIIFDMAINHTSDEHFWFREAIKSTDNDYRDYYIWSKDTSLYNEARIIFKGIEKSNWEAIDDWYYFHRFFSFQPDLNYRNPKVLFEMCRNMIFWKEMGIDGFRADAIPYLWKDEGTDCENLPITHVIVKFFRAVLDYLQPGTLLLAEACQQPKEVVKYLGEGDECHAAYHFPLMPRIFKSLAQEHGQSIIETLSTAVTPAIPNGTQWFSFLRCHDELSLELVYVTEEDRKYIHEQYCHQPLWDFREGEGISARLSELFGRDPLKIQLAYSLMLTLMGTPVIYYGDEFGKFNDEEYYQEQIQYTGKDDTRFLVRGRIDWEWLDKKLKDTSSFQFQIYSALRNMIQTRSISKTFGRGSLDWVQCEKSILGYYRKYEGEKILVLNNLSGNPVKIVDNFDLKNTKRDMLDQNVLIMNGKIHFAPYSFHWFQR